MFNKIYLALFIVAILVVSAIAFFTFSQLQSVGFPPPQIAQNFLDYDSLFKTALFISSLVLLVLANVILWTNRKAWALWLTFIFFAIFISLDMWWLNSAFVAYQKQNNLFNGSFQVGGIFSAFMIVIVGIGVFFNQFLVFRLRDKMFQQPVEEVEKPVQETEKPEEV